MRRHSIITLAAVLIMAVTAFGQTSEFTYQGSLSTSGMPANGTYDLTFVLYDSPTGGTRIGPQVTLNGTNVVNGIFTVQLDFGAAAFANGGPRFLLIGVRQGGPTDPFTPLTPRQEIKSAPFAIKSLNADTANTATTADSANNATTAATANNALQLGGVAANQYVVTTDPRMTDARNPTAGSGNYIQNSTSTQTASNFSISGNGTAGGTLSGNIVRAVAHFDLGFNRVLKSPESTSIHFGANSGNAITTGMRNSFFGFFTGNATTSGENNLFIGSVAGQRNTTGSNNTFVGRATGIFNTTGSSNIFIGEGAGFTNATGSNNTTVGRNSDVAEPNLSFATALGAGSVATESNSVTLGRSNDIVYVPGFIRVQQLGGAGATALCRNNNNTVGTCSSSLRYKSNIEQFGLGLNLVKQFKPITFNWKDGGMLDLGLVAEDVAAIDPLLVTYNDKGEIEGVKYDRIGVVLVNAVKEQQKKIEAQQAEIEELKIRLSVIDELKKMVCAANPSAEICRDNK